MEPRLGGRRITPDAGLTKKLLNATDQTERETIIKLIQQDIAGQVPQNWWDKFDAWRYTAMLANPRTHIRNILGNAVFVPARKIKDVAAWGLERGNLLLPTKFGQKKWAKVKDWGFSEEQYAKYYKIAAQQKKKAEIMANLQKAGMTQQQAADFWGIVKSK